MNNYFEANVIFFLKKVSALLIVIAKDHCFIKAFIVQLCRISKNNIETFGTKIITILISGHFRFNKCK